MRNKLPPPQPDVTRVERITHAAGHWLAKDNHHHEANDNYPCRAKDGQGK